MSLVVDFDVLHRLFAATSKRRIVGVQIIVYEEEFNMKSLLSQLVNFPA